MKGYRTPITEETFPRAARYVLRLCRKNIAKNRAYGIAVPLGTGLFMVLALIFTYGGIYSISTEDDAAVFESLKPITAVWEWVAQRLALEGAAWYIQLAVFVGALFLVPMAVCLIVSLVCRLTAGKVRLPESANTTAEKAKALHETLSGIKTKEVEFDTLAYICAGVYIALVAAFTVYSMVLTVESLPGGGLASIILGALVAFAIAFFVFAYMFMLSYVLNVWACRPGSTYQVAKDIHDFWCAVDPEEAKRTEEQKKTSSTSAASSYSSVSLYKDTAYYQERKAQTMRNIDKYVYGYDYPDYQLTGLYLQDKENLRQYLRSNAPESEKQAAIKKYNDYHLDNFIE